jgi:hypothetical protein
MNYKDSILKQFDELIALGKRVEAEGEQAMEWELDKTPDGAAKTQTHNMSRESFALRAVQLVVRTSGPKSLHTARIERLDANRHNYQYSTLNNHLGVLQAAKQDFDAGQFTDLRRLVRADLLDDFISQAEELQQSGFNEAAVSLAGAILEDTLRKLCDKHSIPVPVKTSLDPLNSALYKAGAYDLLVQKRITHLAQLRNDADHGRTLGTVKPEDAKDFVGWLRRFVTEYLT